MLENTTYTSSFSREVTSDGRRLANRLMVMKPLAATALACEWALSSEVSRRHAIAHALETAVTVFGEGTLLEHLAADEEPEVREAAHRSAYIRRASRRSDGHCHAHQ